MLDSERMIETPTEPKTTRPQAGSGFSSAIRILLLLAVLGVLGVLIYNGIHTRQRTAAAVREETQELAVPMVSVARPRLGPATSEIVLPGSIQAFVDSPIYARASGYLKKWYTDIGTRVTAGQELAEIDAPELDQQVTQAQGALSQAQAAVEQAGANLQQGRANEDLARVTAERWKNLVAKGAVSRQENDTYQAQYQAQVANVDALEKAVAAARSNLAVAQANLGRLEDLQAFKIVRAPFDGIITARNTDYGALINAGNGGPSQELFHIAAVSKLRVFANVPQAYARSVAAGIPAALTLAEFPGRKFQGKVVRTSETMDAGTRTLLVEVDLDNAGGELRPGAYAEVHLSLPASTHSVIVPVAAILFRSEGLRLGVLHGNRVQLVPVVLGKDFGTEVEVMSGINAEDQIVMDPPDSLTSGATVQVVPRNAARPE